jgi:hypothetical protein
MHPFYGIGRLRWEREDQDDLRGSSGLVASQR